MKYLILFLFLAPLFAQAEPVLTTVTFDGESHLYLGAKQEIQGKNTASAIGIVNAQDMTHELIYLPASIATRDVLGIVPEEKKIFIITQQTSGQSDNPLLSVYTRDTKSWKDIHSVDCPSFTEVSFTPKALIFHCDMGQTRRGKTKVKKKSLSLDAERIHQKGSMRFPEFLTRYKKMDISLEGIALSWNRLHIRGEGRDRVLTAVDLFTTPSAASVGVPTIGPATPAATMPQPIK